MKETKTTTTAKTEVAAAAVSAITFEDFLKKDTTKWNTKWPAELVEATPERFRPDTTLRTAYWTPEIRATWDAVKSKGTTKKNDMLDRLEKACAGNDEALAIIAQLKGSTKGETTASFAVKLFKTDKPEKGAEYAITEEDLGDVVNFMINVNKLSKKLEPLVLKVDVANKKVLVA